MLSSQHVFTGFLTSAYFYFCPFIFLFLLGGMVSVRLFCVPALIYGTVQMFLTLSSYCHLLWVGGQRVGGEAATLGWG